MRSVLLALSTVMFFSSSALAEVKEYPIVIKDHKFSPDVIEVPAGEKVKLKVSNQDSTAEEFESHTLKREKIIPGNTEATILIGPLKAGTYEFMGEFHQETAKGKVVAK